MYGQHNKVTKDEVRKIDSHVGSRLRYRRDMMDHSQTFIAERVGLFFRSSSNMKREQIGLKEEERKLQKEDWGYLMN